MRKFPILLVSLVALVVVPFADSEATTTAPDVYITSFVTINGATVHVTPKTAPQYADLRIVVTNTGAKAQRFAFDDTILASGKHTGFNQVFKPHTHHVFLFELEVQGQLKYYLGSSFAKASGAGRGLFVVGPPCTQCNS